MFLHGYRESISNQCATEKGFAMGGNGINNIPTDVKLNKAEITNAAATLKAAGATAEQIEFFMKDKKISASELELIKNQNTAEPTSSSVSYLSSEGLDDEQLELLVKNNIITKVGDKYQLNNGKTAQNIQQVLQEQADNVKPEPTATFTAESAPEIINELKNGDNPAIEPKNSSEENPHVFTVKDEQVLRKVLNEPADGELQITVNEVKTPIKLKISTITTETSPANPYGAPDEETMRTQDLESRSVRKAATKQYRQALEKWLADDKDGSHLQQMNNSIADKFYAKDIEKRYKKLAKQPENQPHLLVKNYMDGLAQDDDLKVMYNTLLDVGRDVLTKPEKQLTPEEKDLRQGILNLQDASNTQKLEHLTGDKDVLERAITDYAIAQMKSNGYDVVDRLLYTKAQDEILSKRSPEKVAKDKEKYLKYMSKREVRNFRDENRMENTVCFYSKEEYKAYKKEHPEQNVEYIGKYARKMVENRPDMFCNEVPSGGDFTVNGKSYKFDSEKYKAAIGDMFDNGRTKDDAGNYHATLSEVKDYMSKSKLYKTDDNRGTLEDLFGNGNGHVGYWEGRRMRNIVEGTGRSVDKDRSNWMVAGKTVEKTALAFAMGFIPGVAAAKGVQTVTQVAGSVISIPSQVMDINGYNIEIPSKTIKSTDTLTETFGGEQFTTTTTRTNHVLPDYVNINGQRYDVVDGKVTIDGKSIDISKNINKIEIDGKVYELDKDGNLKIDGKNVVGKASWGTAVKQGLKAGGITALLALPASFLTSLSTEDRGDTEDVVNLYSTKTTTKSEDKTENIEITRKTQSYDISCQRQVETKLDSRKFQIYAGPAQYAQALYKVDGQKLEGGMLTAMRKAMQAEWEKLGAKPGTIPREIPGIKEIKFTYNGQEYTATLYDDWKTRPIAHKAGGRGGLSSANLGQNKTISAQARIVK